MKKLLAINILILINIVATAQNNSEKPTYAGHIEYTKGNFGSYNYPAKRDSILVYLKDSTIMFVIFPRKEISKPRNLEISLTPFKLVNKKEYNNIVTINKIVATGNYDLKFATKNSTGDPYSTIYITHYGNGSIAEMTLSVETDGTRLNDLFVATLVKLK